VTIDQEPPWRDRLWTLVEELRQADFALGTDDVAALRQALAAGFGWSSRESLCDLLVALWAKSRRDRETLRSHFARMHLPQWPDPHRSTLPPAGAAAEPRRQIDASGTATHERSVVTQGTTSQEQIVVQPGPTGSLPVVPLDDVFSNRSLVFVPHFPLTHREVAQAFRRLRRPVRFGAPIDLDVEATVARRSKQGVASAPTLVPRRRNLARLLLLVDRDGSMRPHHAFVDEFIGAVRDAGWLQQVTAYYFHDVPSEGADRRLLASLDDRVLPSLDTILGAIPPLIKGSIYRQPDLSEGTPVADVLQGMDAHTVAVVIGDAGAARRRPDAERLLDTVAFLKALRARVRAYVWLNPVPKSDWPGTLATEVARHAPMFALDRAGMHRAINVLRGQPPQLERPL
jgi:uncharacterized protein